MSNIENYNYFQISGWMLNELELKGYSLMVYAIIYGFSQDKESYFCGSRQYLSDFTGASLSTIDRCLTELCDKQLINKYTHTRNNITFNRYRTNYDKIGYSHNDKGIFNLNRGGVVIMNSNNKEEDIDNIKEIDNKEKDYSSDIDFLGTIPTLQEVKDFITLKQLPIDAEDFYNYYSSIGWMQNNSPIKNWQYKALQWGKREGMKNGLKDIAVKQQTPIQQRQCDYKFGEIEISDDEI